MRFSIRDNSAQYDQDIIIVLGISGPIYPCRYLSNRCCTRPSAESTFGNQNTGRLATMSDDRFSDYIARELEGSVHGGGGNSGQAGGGHREGAIRWICESHQ